MPDVMGVNSSSCSVARPRAARGTRDVRMYFPKIGGSTLRPTHRDGRVGFSNLIHYATHPQPSSYVAPHIL
jgi:hypothetical protein